MCVSVRLHVQHVCTYTSTTCMYVYKHCISGWNESNVILRSKKCVLLLCLIPRSLREGLNEANYIICVVITIKGYLKCELLPLVSHSQSLRTCPLSLREFGYNIIIILYYSTVTLFLKSQLMPINLILT